MMMAVPSLLFGSQRVPSSFSAQIAKVDKLKMMVAKAHKRQHLLVHQTQPGMILTIGAPWTLSLEFSALKKSKIMDRVLQACEELKRMPVQKSRCGLRVWRRPKEKYLTMMSTLRSSRVPPWPKRSTEASRDTAVVFVDGSSLLDPKLRGCGAFDQLLPPAHIFHPAAATQLLPPIIRALQIHFCHY